MEHKISEFVQNIEDAKKELEEEDNENLNQIENEEASNKAIRETEHLDTISDIHEDTETSQTSA